MRIGTRGRYALVIMFYLANNYKDNRYVSLKEISESENLSFKYLEKIMIDLNKDNYLDVLRGNNGGYRLKMDPKYYTLGDILRRVEGDLASNSCIDGTCNKNNKCTSYKFFNELYKEINNYVDNKTLEDYL